MSKDRRLYGRFTLDFADSAKIAPLSDSAFRTLVEMTLHSRRMLDDGFVDVRIARRKWPAEAIEELLDNDRERPSLRVVEGGYEIHDFAEHQQTKDDIEKKREAGTAGGRASAAARAKAPAKADAQALGSPDARADAQPKSKLITETESKTETTSSKELVRVSDADFEQAWAFWPKKVERKKAAEMFKRVAKKLGTQELIQHVHVFGTAYAETTDRQFVPALDVWLRNERWTDELPRHPSRTQPQRLTRADENALEFERLYGGDQHGGTRGVQALDAGFGS